ncbi:MAG: hypothetical protein JKY22_00370 [Flavobacteriaceae bacterium]|nr:hypothetical protein [Flavobacteriaceae bacterium]
MKISKKHIAVGMIAIGLATTAGAGITVASEHKGKGHAEVAATLLGISVDDFKTRVQNGEKPREIFEAAGIDREDIKAAHEQRMQERLAQAVESGRLTQAEADEKIAKREGMKTVREAAHTAVENNDYDAWALAVANSPRESTVDTFNKLVLATQLREAGDHEGAKEIMKELGFNKKHRK